MPYVASIYVVVLYERCYYAREGIHWLITYTVCGVYTGNVSLLIPHYMKRNTCTFPWKSIQTYMQTKPKHEYNNIGIVPGDIATSIRTCPVYVR